MDPNSAMSSIDNKTTIIKENAGHAVPALVQKLLK